MGSYVLGIDPGRVGGVACLSPTGKVEWVIPMPVFSPRVGQEEIDTGALDVYVIGRFGISPLPLTAFVEEVQPFPNSSRKAAFTFGRNYEAVLSWCKVRGLSYSLVLPKVWQRAVLGRETSDKKVGLAWVRRRHPELDLGGHDGMSDALLIAEYGRLSGG